MGALILYSPVLKAPDYVVGPGPNARVLFARLLEVILAITIVATAVALFPVAKRENEATALGYVGLRTLEAATITVGVCSLLAVVTLRQQHAGSAGSDIRSLVVVAQALVPRFISVLGLIGGPLVFVVALGVLFGLYKQVSPIGAIAAVPAFAWALSLALWLICKGFDAGRGTLQSSRA